MNDQAIGIALREGLLAAAEGLLMTSTTPWDLDAAMNGFGFSQGVCEAQDMVGLDVDLATRQRRCETLSSPILSRMVAQGRLGQRAGVGWYRYPGGGGLVIDPLVEDLLREEARFAKIERFEQTDPALVEGLCSGILAPALEILAQTGVDAKHRVDFISTTATGFPTARGGILTYACEIGRAQAEKQVQAVPLAAEKLHLVTAGLDRLFE